jgi:hypothetical protein
MLVLQPALLAATAAAAVESALNATAAAAASFYRASQQQQLQQPAAWQQQQRPCTDDVQPGLTSTPVMPHLELPRFPPTWNLSKSTLTQLCFGPTPLGGAPLNNETGQFLKRCGAMLASLPVGGEVHS